MLKKSIVRNMAAALLLGACTSCSPGAGEKAGSEPEPQRVVVAYVTSWGKRLPDAQLVTHFNYAFGHVTDSFNGVRIDNPDRLRAVVELRKQKPDLKVLLSVGGWGSGRFSEMAGSEEYRTAFANDCRRVVEEFGLDGIDIDWEYPTSSSAGISSSEDDRDNFTLLMRDIRQAIGREHLLTFADYADTTFVDYRQVMPYVDLVNLMTYDISNPPYHHSALYLSERAIALTVSAAVEHHLEAGVPHDKLVMGMPFYSRSGKGFVSPELYDQLMHDEQYHVCWDSLAQVPYLADAEGTLVLAFDNEESLRAKCDYILSAGLRGGMYWDADSDTDDWAKSKTVYSSLIEGIEEIEGDW